MTERIHIVVDQLEKRFKRHAARAGKSLSEWLRDLARERVDKEAAAGRLDTAAELAHFHTFDRALAAAAGS